MFDNLQFRSLIVKPVLNGINLWSPVAEELLVATMAQETLGGTYLKQKDGNALGIYQMMPKTHDEIWEKYLPNFPELTHRLMQICKMSAKPLSEMLVYHLFYATAMARVFYLRCPQALPESLDVDSLWLYYKKWWNTDEGSTTREEFVANYGNFIKGRNENEGQKRQAKRA